MKKYISYLLPLIFLLGFIIGTFFEITKVK